ncbi:DNA repair protein RadA [bacterium DOLJORAL78_65_58]|nr:MAG: DNA repair protein RadA [bacterium DOLZORAL124_64_63]PIE76128.1 MAG: DNA repair protein RadA [bacterium DOLJORAL78_65_58]
MAKSTTRFYCQECGHEELRWLGRCPGCQSWNSFAEMKLASKSGSKGARGFQSGAPQKGPVGFAGRPGPAQAGRLTPLNQVDSAERGRLPVQPQEVARVLGGGLVEGSVVLLGGEPGVGKSTLLTGQALEWTRAGIRVLYVAGEESPAQIRMRAERLGFKPDREEGFHILPEVCLESLLDTLAADLAAAEDGRRTIVIADSIQTLHSESIDAFPGSPTQIKYCGGVLADFARRTNCPVFLVGHVTKSGDLAGPKLLEHMVDTVLYFEGSDGGPIRMVRAVKNRFGTTGELAVLEMRGDGLFPVDQAGVLFLSGRRGVEPGSAVCAVRNGSRTFLVEVQALVSPSRYGTPQRVVQGVDGKRVALLAAILEKRAGLDLGGCDTFVKVAGGGRIDDPGADMAILTALASSLRERPVPQDTLVLGEVGLTGEVRRVTDLEHRLREAARHGFRRAVLADPNPGGKPPGFKGLKMQLITVTSVEEAVALAVHPGAFDGSREAGR